VHWTNSAQRSAPIPGSSSARPSAIPVSKYWTYRVSRKSRMTQKSRC
jgi:hypothetical protein